MFDDNGKEVTSVETLLKINAGDQTELDQKLSVSTPKLWSIEEPNLYILHSMIIEKGKVIDETTTTVGFRKIEYDVDKGFFLNGKHVKMNGVCLHHDGGAVGAAVPIGVWERRLKN